jgi:hypothetical protein
MFSFAILARLARALLPEVLMAISIPADEQVLERQRAFAGGKLQELVLTDKAIYYEGQRAPIATWISAILLPVLAIIGLGLFYYYLRGGRLMVRHSLERIDAVTVRRIPMPGIAQIGAVLALIFGVNFGLHIYLQDYDWQRGLLFGYGVTVALCLVAAIILVRFQLSSLSVNALNGNFTYDAYGAFGDLQRVQDRIWLARGALMSRLLLGPSGFPQPSGPSATPNPAPSSTPAASPAPVQMQKQDKRNRRR